jgi:hypothetical protein
MDQSVCRAKIEAFPGRRGASLSGGKSEWKHLAVVVPAGGNGAGAASKLTLVSESTGSAPESQVFHLL